jgi:hypothetical protein
MSEQNVTWTLCAVKAWDNLCSAASDPVADVALAVAWVQQASGGRDPALISIRAGAWAALLASESGRQMTFARGMSVEKFRQYTGARDVRLFADDSPVNYDLRVVGADGETFELRHACMFQWRSW